MSSNVSMHGMDERLLVFSVGEEEFAIPLLQVRQVIAQTKMMAVPKASSSIAGIINLRGEVYTIVDLRKKFGINNTESNEEAIIVLHLPELSLGILVDSVNQVLAVDGADFSPPPDLDLAFDAEYIEAVVRQDQGMLLLLNIEKAMSAEEMRAIKRNRDSGTLKEAA